MSLYNDDELTSPEWVNHKFFEKVLNNYKNCDNIEVINFEVSPASMKGDHYASIMFRCKVSYRLGKDSNTLQISLIIKTLPTEDNLKRELLQDSLLFETEIKMFTETLPKTEQILAEFGEPTKLSAKIYYHSLEPHKVLVLEDLCESGYNVIRDRYLNEQEVKAVFEKIAKLHAVSYMLGHSEDHDLVTNYRKGAINSSLAVLNDIVPKGLDNFVKMLSCYDEFSIYQEKFCAMKDKLYAATRELFDAYTANEGKGDIFVLNHGDFHMKNMMFKMNKNNEMEDLIFVDYQISLYGPSAVDMSYSQFLILSSELRLKRHEFMFYYFTEFTKILKKIKCPGELPKFSQFQMTALKYRHYTIFLLSVFLPMVCRILGKKVEELKEFDVSQFVECPDTIASSYYSPEYLDDVRAFMPILLWEGYFD